MTAVDIAKANVAASAIERCLRIKRKGGYCGRLMFPQQRPANRNGIWPVTAGLPFILMLIGVLAALAHR